MLTDIDDTMTTGGLLPSSSLRAMERMCEAGVIVIPVTGRPAGWCDHIARMWPVDAVVGENGALWFSYDREAQKMNKYYVKDAEERSSDRKRLAALRERILREVPESAVASDQDYRVADLAIDFCEDVSALSEEKVNRIVDLFEEAGATTKVSSIHVNGWFGAYDKLSTTRHCLKELFGIEMDASNETIVFAGDSPNDMPMFEFFQHSIGVANVGRFSLEHEPTWITDSEGADGFSEIAEAILAARKSMSCVD